MAAVEHPEIGFVVLLAGPGLPGDELLALQSRTILAARGVGKAQIDVIEDSNRRIYAIVNGEPDDERAAEEIRGAMKSLGMQDSQIDVQIRSLLSPWMRFFLSYDPRPALRKLRCPVLALNGSLDVQVPPEENLGAVRAALEDGGNPDFTVRRLHGLNHLFQHAETGQPEEYVRIEETFAPEALELIADWLDEAVSP
jgi:pimeloyl-ACP methyl ester carboxylesterase